MQPKDERVTFRMKVWHDENGKCFLMPLVMCNIDTNVVVGIAVSDEGNMQVTMTLEQWNTLPYYGFTSTGPTERLANPPMLGTRNLIPKASDKAN